MNGFQGTRRLCAKSYPKQQAIEILIAKANIGYRSSDVVREAEELARCGLRIPQIRKLTSLPDDNVRKVVEAAGAIKLGRGKSSIKDVLNNVHKMALASPFLVAIEHQLEITQSSILVSSHVLTAINTVRLGMPIAAIDADWERMVEMAFSLMDGKVKLTNCCLCGTRYVCDNKEGHGKRCPMCRVAESMTVNLTSGDTTTIIRGERDLIPKKVSRPAVRRQKVRVAMGL